MSGEFREAIQRAGLTPPDVIEPGKFHRFPGHGKGNGNSAGWCKQFPDGAGGVFGDFAAGFSEAWQAKREKPMGEAERREWQERVEREKREAEAERERGQVEARKRAEAIFTQAAPATNDHPYLARKGVKSHGVTLPSGKYYGPKLYRGDLVIAGAPCDGALIVPMTDAKGALWSLQFIAADGSKKYLPGARVKGCYFGIGSSPKEVQGLCIAEGYATAASVHAASGYPVVVAFDAGNLLPVASALRDKYPAVRLIVCADDDAGTAGNPGLTKATEAARAIGGLVAVPDFGEQRPEGAADFNDLAAHRGPAAVRACIEAAGAERAQSAGAQAEQQGEPRAQQSQGASPDADDWPEPQPLPDQLPAVVPFSFDLLPDEIRGWIEDIAERVQCPPEFPAVAAVSALGSVIGRKLAVRPKARDDWEEFPNLWGVVVGAPGVLKTPALMEALRPLRALEARAREQHAETLIAWQAEREGAKIKRDAARNKAKQAAGKGQEFDAASLVLDEKEQEPQPRRYIVNDSSVEALGLVLQASPTGLLAYRDELIGLLKSLDREGQEGARAFYLSAYSGKEPHVYDRIGRGLNIRVDHVCLSLLGSIQPSVIGRYLREAFDNGGDDGLLSRFSLLVWPDVSGAWKNVDRWPDTEARRAASALFERMDSLDPLQVGAEQEEGCAPFLRLSEGALVAFVEWREAFERRQRDSGEHPALVAHFAKYRKLVPALALVFHLASRGTGPVAEAAILRALAWVELLESHARRAYASVQHARMEAARALLVKIRAGVVGNPIRPRDVYLKGWSGLSDPEDVRRAAELLADMDYLRAEIAQTPGRSRTVYWINPRARA